MDHDVYLQGSYPNYTNIRGDSDVDVVVETSNVFYNDLPLETKQQMGLTAGSYTWEQFKDQAVIALTNYYGHNVVTPNSKCIKVKGDGGHRLDADVVPCNTYRQYNGTIVAASGITFWTQTGQQIINYPKLHLKNGSAKNSTCSMNYKPSVRMFKNARNRAQSKALGRYPSYFLECLLYNVPTLSLIHI